MRRNRRRNGFPSAFAVVVAALVAGAHAGAAPRAGEGLTVHETWRTFTTRDGLPDASIRSILVVDGDVWVGTDSGLARRTDEGWESWTAEDGLPDAPISAIDLDPRTGDLWLGTWGAGLVRFTGGRFDRFDQFDSGLAGDLILDVTVIDGRVWIAGNGGVSVFEPTEGSWDLHLERRADAAVPAATDLRETREGILAGTWSGPLLLWNAGEGSWSAVAGPSTAVAGRLDSGRPAGASVLAEDPAGRAIWWTDRGRLHFRKPGKSWPGQRVTRPDLARGFVIDLAAGSDREVWLGTSAGLQVLADRKSNTWVLYGPEAHGSGWRRTVVRGERIVGSRPMRRAFPHPYVRCLALQGDAVWAGTPRGLVLGTDRTGWAGAGAETSGEGSTESTGAVDDPAPPDATAPDRPDGEARIGVLGPFTRPVPLPGSESPWPTLPVDRVAVARAVERTNEVRGGAARTLVLADNLVSFTMYGWVTAQDSFAVLRDRHRVHGLVGSIEPEARMDAAVAFRTELPIVNIAAGPPTQAETSHPWIFRCASNDPRHQAALLDFVLASRNLSRPAVLRMPGARTADDRVDRWVRLATSRGIAPVADLECDPEAGDLPVTLESLRASGADFVLTWADARTTATLVRELRSAGLDLLVVGGDSIVSDEFVKLAGREAAPVLALPRCPHLDVTGDIQPVDEEVRRRRPDIARRSAPPQAGRSFDAVLHLFAAFELAGTEPEAARRALARMGRPRFARLRDGVWIVEEPGADGPG